MDKVTLTEKVRQSLIEKVGVCPTCGSSEGGLRKIAIKLGIAHSTLWRFLKGKQLQSNTLDKLVLFLKLKVTHG